MLDPKEVKEIQARDSWLLLGYYTVVTSSLAVNEYLSDFKACPTDRERQMVAKEEILKRMESY